MTDLLVIANGRNQKGFRARRWQRAISRLREIFGTGLEIRYTSHRGDGARLTREALVAGVDWLAAAGGDGTIHEVLNGFFDNGINVRPSSSLSFLPCGLGNDWIRTLGLPMDLFGSIELLGRARPHLVDVGHARFQGLSGRTEDEVFINIAEAGIGAKVVEYMEHGVMPVRNHLAYVMGAFIAILSYLPRPLELELDGDKTIATDPLLSLIVANGCYFGAGMKCAPMARPDDGRLEVIAVGEFSRAEAALKFRSFMNGTYLDLPRVEHYSSKAVGLASGDRVPLELDGELVGHLPAHIRLLPQAVRLRY